MKSPIERAAQLWCLPQFADREMDVEFAEAIAGAIREAQHEQREQQQNPKPDPITCAHDFEEIELGGLGKIKRCRHCGTAREVKQEKKRKRFRAKILTVCGNFVMKGDTIELEEVE